jgi:hypothetical protein
MVKTAPMGYSGLFDAVKVKEKELEQLYAFDYTLLDNVTRVAAGVDAVQNAVGSEALPGAIRALVDLVAECNSTFERRREVLLGQ